MSKLEKQVVRVAMLDTVWVLSQMVDSAEPDEESDARRRRYLQSRLEEVSDPAEWMGLHDHDDSSSDPFVDDAAPQINAPLQSAMFHVYLFTQVCFRRTSTYYGYRSTYARSWLCFSSQSVESSEQL